MEIIFDSYPVNVAEQNSKINNGNFVIVLLLKTKKNVQ